MEVKIDKTEATRESGGGSEEKSGKRCGNRKKQGRQ